MTYNLLFDWLAYGPLLTPIAGNSALAWLSFLLLSWLLWRSLRFACLFAQRRLTRRESSGMPSIFSINLLAQCLERVWKLTLAALALYIAAAGLVLPEAVQRSIDRGMLLLVLLQFGRCISYVAHALIEQRLLLKSKDPSVRSAIALINFASSCVIWAIIALLALDNLGVNVTTLIAGLGIGGIAVALAVQKVLGDLLSSLSIILDKPFVVGDIISVAEITGTVEHIGIKTTRLRAPAGEVVVITNSDILSSRIRNLRAINERRCVFSFCLSHQLPIAVAAEVPGKIREIISAIEHVRFERAHFRGFVENGFLFEVAYVVSSADLMLSLDLHQQICLAIGEYFAEAKIEFAAPVARPQTAAAR
jgi:small-conductance mechanosensitive channel